MYRLLPRACAFFVLAAIVIPAIHYAQQYVQATTLYPGDRTEVRECRICEDGKPPDDLREETRVQTDACPVCAGQGKVDVIVPGPERPTTIHGAVVLSFEDGYGFEPPPAISNSALMTPCPGGVPDAEIVITPDAGGSPIRMVTNSYGRFLTRLAPGEYTVTIRPPGQPEQIDALSVEPLEADIWVEKARVVMEPETDAEWFAWYGRNVTFILEE